MVEKENNIQFTITLFKASFDMYKSNFKAYACFVLAFFTISIITSLSDLYFKPPSLFYTINMFSNLLINGLLSIMLTYFVYLKSRIEEVTIKILLSKIKDRFWKVLWTTVVVFSKCTLIVLLLVFGAIGIMYAFNFKTTFPYFTTICLCVIAIIFLFFYVIKYAFVNIIAIVEEKSVKPFNLNRSILKGNYRLVTLPVGLLTIQIIITVIVFPLIKDSPFAIKFTAQSIMILFNNIIHPFTFTTLILLYNYLRKKHADSIELYNRESTGSTK